MAERKATNKYYPPDWTPDKGSINKYVGQHPLRDRARKLDQGILIIRSETSPSLLSSQKGPHYRNLDLKFHLIYGVEDVRR